MFLKKLAYTPSLPLATNQSVTHPTIHIKTALSLCGLEHRKRVRSFACFFYFSLPTIYDLLWKRGQPLPILNTSESPENLA